MSRRVRLVRDAFTDVPGLDTAVSRVLLERVAAGDLPETFRLHTAGRVLAFARRDARAAGYPAAVEAAHRHGFVPVQRLAGGRAAVFSERTLAFSHVIPDPDPAAGILPRFVTIAEVMRDALAGFGIDARIGGVPGEYCPGDHSINARGAVKIVGAGQRLIAGGAHVGGVVVVGGADDIRAVLIPVYDALGLDWDPATVGSLEDEIGPVTNEAVAGAVLARLADRFDLVDATVDADTVAAARSRLADYVV